MFVDASGVGSTTKSKEEGTLLGVEAFDSASSASSKDKREKASSSSSAVADDEDETGCNLFDCRTCSTSSKMSSSSSPASSPLEVVVGGIAADGTTRLLLGVALANMAISTSFSFDRRKLLSPAPREPNEALNTLVLFIMGLQDIVIDVVGLVADEKEERKEEMVIEGHTMFFA